MKNYLAFDIETAKVTPDESKLKDHRPLGISCAALAWVEDGNIETMAFSGKNGMSLPSPQMSKEECVAFVDTLYAAAKGKGFTLLAHNGLGFDFDILAEESGMHDTCAELALHSVDTCLLVHCLKGFPVGLEAIVKGMGLSGKTEGMSGALAPPMWAEGRCDEVLEYVQQDARATLRVALEIEKRKGLMWIAKSGRCNSLPIPKLLTAAEALQLPEPDTSWMTEPIPRSRFTGWIDALISDLEG